MKRRILKSDGGFSLLEITVVIIIVTILVSAAIPVLGRAYLEKAGNKTALDINAIQDAARAYYIDHNHWPTTATPIAELQTGEYLPQWWIAINPFGDNNANPSTYAYAASVQANKFIVATYVPTSAQSIIRNLVPISWVSGNMLYSSIGVPGSTSVMPTGSIIAWASNTKPDGFLWCNGATLQISSYQGLYAVLGTTYGGDGINTFNLPDLMGRTIVGVDGMGAVTEIGRIPSWSGLPNLVGAPDQIGSTFGEYAHQQSITEMAPHHHDIFTVKSYDHGPNIGNTNQSLSAWPTVFHTGDTGGDGKSAFGAPANVVQPSIVMGYIIKD